MGEASGLKSLFVGAEGFGDEDVFDGIAFASDFEVAVAVGAFEVVVEICQLFLDTGFFEMDFFG